MSEAPMTVKGLHLTDWEVTTIRVALISFMEDLNENGLGRDPTGVTISENYQRAARDILTKMLS